MGGIEFFIVLAVTAFDLAVMPGCIRPDQFVPNPQTLKLSFKRVGLLLPYCNTYTASVLPGLELD